MLVFNKKEPFLFFVGDILVFFLSLWMSLFIRNFDIPAFSIYLEHIIPFGIIFVLWVLVFFVSGLYNKYTTILKGKIPLVILNAQIFNSFIAIAFFYLIPYFGITPKTILFIDILVSFILIYIWRVYGQYFFKVRRKISAIIVGSGEEIYTLEKEVNNNPVVNLKFVSSINLDKVDGIDFVKEITDLVYLDGLSVVVIDLKDPRIEKILPHLYNLIFSGVRFIDIYKVYEDVFDRIPLSLIKYNWFLENISLRPNFGFDLLKRFFDIVISIILTPIFLILLPFVFILVKIEDGGKLFFSQDRIGRKNKIIKIYKFRTMTNDEKITKIGNLLRKTRIDELPQLWNVFMGNLSLIGPRPEKPDLVFLYEKEIPYYNIRHLVKPGLSGWAQICQDNPPKFEINFNDTKTKLSYDLYYLKNKSIFLDVKIALKTMGAIFSRKGK
ncbi:MAG: sugar transferase [Candidatus Paceibacterota bacterium]|jgi:lipopolysaccharide/colanic/teichoic acid biosynthesis glycosyltransferase